MASTQIRRSERVTVATRRKLRFGPHRSQTAVFRASRRGSAPRPTVMLLHGGSWSWPYGRWLMVLVARDARRRGWNTYNVKYRRLGRFGGGGGWPATFTDVTAALDALVDRLNTGKLGSAASVDKRVAVVGHSAGGHLALWLAAERSTRLTGVVSMGGPTDLERLAANPANVTVIALVEDAPAAERWDLTSPAARLPTGTPTCLVHGSDDTVVAPEWARRYAELATAAGDAVELHVIDGEKHRDGVRPKSGQWQATVAAVERWFGS